MLAGLRPVTARHVGCSPHGVRAMHITTKLGAAVLVARLITFAAGVARADGAVAAGVTQPGVLRQEGVGLELTPVVGVLADQRSGVVAGIGGTVRLMRHRWTRFYWTPLQAGLFI